MKGRVYDIKKLADSGRFDTTVRNRFYYDNREYFDALSDFAENFERDMGNYTPAFVVNCDEDREEFMKECFEVRASLMRLGAGKLLDLLLVMENAAISRNAKEFADGQVNFHANLRICQDIVRDAAVKWMISV